MMYDICVIGSGAGGSPIAYELSNAGYNVVVLEKGKEYTEKDFNKDELSVSRRKIFTPRLEDEQHVINYRNKKGKVTRYLGSESGWSFWNGSMVGGSSNLMSGYFHRMKPSDFKLKTIYGAIKDANIVDWPISYEDLEPYYDKVEKVIGISGKVEKHKFAEPRSSKEFPFQALVESNVTKWFDWSCKKLGYESIQTPRAILPHNALNREGCSYSNFCGSYGCATGAKGSARAALLQNCNASIITEAFVYRLESNKYRVFKAHYYDKKMQSHEIKAKIFVVAAQAIESSRLLLNSKNKYFPNGLANNNGEVGKNLIFSSISNGQGRFRFENLTIRLQEELMERGVFFNRSLQNFYEYTKKQKKYKGGTIDFLFEHADVIAKATKEFYDKHGNLIWGEELQKKIYKNIKTSRVLIFEAFCDWLPNDYCFVSIDENVQDKYKVPVGSINVWSHPHNTKVSKYLAKKGVKVLQKMGAKEISYKVSSIPPSNLVAGGCRFGNDPKNSVLDKNCKAHELENLYVTDASFMPTGGSVPYTWTIYANSFRVADLIKTNLIDL